MQEFSRYECDLLTNCADEPERYGININSKTSEVTITDKLHNKNWRLGNEKDVLVKLFRYCQIEPSFKISK
jgi:hypothetical protein